MPLTPALTHAHAPGAVLRLLLAGPHRVQECEFVFLPRLQTWLPGVGRPGWGGYQVWGGGRRGL